MPHLVVDISAHGFGHLAQTAAVLSALRHDWQPVRLTLRTAHDRETLEDFIDRPFDLADPVPEIGMAMHDPNRVDMAATRRFYLDLHAGWDDRIAVESARFSALRPDLLLANVPDVSLAAAARAGIPAMACCSLNWHDILAAYAGDDPALWPVLDRMRAAYRTAQPFIRFAPALPMADLPDAVAVGPVARIGRDRRAALADRLGLAAGDRLVLVSFGGIKGPPLLPGLPVIPGVVWLVDDPRLHAPRRADLRMAGDAGLSFIDLIASVDLVLTKPGYGTFADTICNGIRLLQFGRPDWPETSWLTVWAERSGVAARLADGAERDPGALSSALTALLDRPRRPDPPPATGGAEAAAIIAASLRLSRL